MIRGEYKRIDYSDVNDNEISMVDLWLILVRRKWLVACCVIVCLLAVAVLALVKAEQYNYISTLKVASNGASEGAGGMAVQLVEPPEMVVAKLNIGYIPFVLSELGGELNSLELKAYIPKDSQLIVLESAGPVSKNGQQVVHEEIVALLRKDHAELLAPHRRKIEHELEAHQIALASLNDPDLLLNQQQAFRDRLKQTEIELERLQLPFTLEAKEERVKQGIENASLVLDGYVQGEVLLVKKQAQLQIEQQLLEKDISSLGRQVEQALEHSMKVGAKASDGIDGIALMLINNAIQENRSRLAKLQHRLQIALPEEALVLRNDLRKNQLAQEAKKNQIDFLREELQQQKIIHKREVANAELPIDKLNLELQQLEANNTREIEAKEVAIKQLNNQLSALTDTALLTPPVYGTVAGIGVKGVLLALVAGLMFGVLLAFFMEFMNAVKLRQVEGRASLPASVPQDIAETKVVVAVPLKRNSST